MSQDEQLLIMNVGVYDVEFTKTGYFYCLECDHQFKAHMTNKIYYCTKCGLSVVTVEAIPSTPL